MNKVWFGVYWHKNGQAWKRVGEIKVGFSERNLHGEKQGDGETKENHVGGKHADKLQCGIVNMKYSVGMTFVSYQWQCLPNNEDCLVISGLLMLCCRVNLHLYHIITLFVYMNYKSVLIFYSTLAKKNATLSQFLVISVTYVVQIFKHIHNLILYYKWIVL